MKNILNIDNGIPTLLSNVDDGTNTLYINDELVPSSQWTGTGYYTFNSGGLTFTIQKIRDDSGNIMLQLIEQSGGTSYRLIKAISIDDKYYSIDDPAETDLADGDYVPFYDTSAGKKKKTLWSNIVEKIKDAIKFIGVTFYSGDRATAEHNANDAIKNGHYYYNSNGPTTSLGASATDGALYVQQWSDSWVGQLAQDYYNGNIFVRGRANGTWSAWKKVEANHADSADVSTKSNNLSYAGTGTGTVTAYQSVDSYFGSPANSWASYLIFNHGNGANYYHQMIRMPFGGSPQYQRMANNVLSGWKDFITSENISSQYVYYADCTKKLNSWYDSRPSSLNVTMGDKALRFFIATSNTSTGKPTIGDSHIIHCAWDHNGGWDAQLAIGNANAGMQFRGQSNGTWLDWVTVITSANIASQSVASVKDYANGVPTKFGYSTAGMAQSSVPWLCAWDTSTSGEYRIRGVRQSDLRVAYATSAGSATDSTKIAIDGTTTSLGFLNNSGQGAAFYKGSYYVKLGNMNQSGQVTLTANRYVQFPNSSGTIAFASSSRRVKKNIRNMTEEEAQKILDIDVVKFDYKGDWCGGEKNRSGFIAEDVMDILPETVQVSKNYDPNLPVDELYNFPPEMDYQRFVPYLVKMVQMQQKEINDLKNKIKALMEG